MILEWSGHSAGGPYRPNNEDAFLALKFDEREVRLLGKVGEDTLEHDDFVFAVSDGVGGAKSGEFASKIAVDKITRLLPQHFRVPPIGLLQGRREALQKLISNIHSEMLVLGRHYEECRGMGATLSLCWFCPEWMYFGHLGDSRVYHVPKDGVMTQLTHDHTFVGYQFRQGLMTEREVRSDPRRNRLQKALGAEQQFVEAQIGSVSIQPHDRFLICSDGVVDGLWDKAIAEAIRSGIDAPSLVKRAIEAGSRDNTTALIVTFGSSGVLSAVAS